MIEKKAVTSGQETETKPVVDLLTSILDEFRKQVQSKTPTPLVGEAERAVEQFREIVAALALRRIITLKADPKALGSSGGLTKLTWTSTDVETVSLKRKDVAGEVPLLDLTPAAGGFRENVPVSTTTIFTATAKGPCGSATATETVTVEGTTIP